ncbi:hypothetical protein EBR66_04880 [bacterium]|nr:hypothetical protein [bacterium]
MKTEKQVHGLRPTLFVISASFAAVVLGILVLEVRTPNPSIELAFTSPSPQGLAIVPASCPSSPHYVGDCSYSQSYYQVYYQNYYQNYYQSYYNTYAQGYYQGYYQTYYQGYYQTSYTNCSSENFCVGNSLYHRGPDNFCTNTPIQNCQYGCSGGACLLPAPSISFTASPKLIAGGGKTKLTWTSTNTSSCSVTEDNSTIVDSWSALSGTNVLSSPLYQKTTYTLTCIGLNGLQPSLTQTVNIIPDWREK